MPGLMKLTLRLPAKFDLNALLPALSTAAGASMSPVMHDIHAVMGVPRDREPAVRAEIAHHPAVSIVSSGRRMEVFKEVGRPDKVADRFNLQDIAGPAPLSHTPLA